jgi:nitrite reductase/ring-hydroxylating ferredoxin subunit
MMANWIHAGSLDDLKQIGAKVIKGGIAVFYHEGDIYAVDNRCPHMGFPLQMGTLCNGILTCHWHHARFDVCSGGTFDPWADDVPTYEAKLEEGEVWVNPAAKQKGGIARLYDRLRDGLQQNLSLVIAKAVVALVEAGEPEAKIAEIGADFGTRQRAGGWASGMTILTAMTNILPKLDKYGRILALFHGLVHVARNCAGQAPRFMLAPLPASDQPSERLAAWYRQCIEVRDTEGSERVLLSAIQQNMDQGQLTQMLLGAVTDHFYLDGGHTLDFHNKAFELLKHVGEKFREQVLTSLVPMLGSPTRSEELHSWRSPIDLVTPVREAFADLEGVAYGNDLCSDGEEEAFVSRLLSDQPIDTITTLTSLLKKGISPVQLAQLTALAAAERVARFHTQNDFGDWISVLHTFTHAHAVQESLRRGTDPLTIRAIYYAAISIYLDRFLNIPSAPQPNAEKAADAGASTQLQELLDLMNRQQQVAGAADWVVHYVRGGGDRGALFNTLGHALLREDAEFHSFQMYEAASVEYDRWDASGSPIAERAKETMLIALTRYLAAHAPTARTLPNTARIAWRLHRGEKLFEEEQGE